jgi:hypothetical protein
MLRCCLVGIAVLLLGGGPLTGCGDDSAEAISRGQASTAGVEPIAIGDLEVQEHDSLHDLMEQAGDDYRFLRRHGDDATFSELARASLRLRALFLQALAMTPEQVEDAPTEQQAGLSAAYQRHLDATFPALDRVDAAIAAQDREALAEAVRALHETEEQGHDALGVDDH